MKTTQTILHQEKLSPVVIVVLNKSEDNTDNSDKAVSGKIVPVVIVVLNIKRDSTDNTDILVYKKISPVVIYINKNNTDNLASGKIVPCCHSCLHNNILIAPSTSVLNNVNRY